jgi:putative Holliday junction resolvase
MKYLGIDYGKRRIGISYGDGELGVAVPIGPILLQRGRGSLWEQLERVVEERRVDAFVLGLPLTADGGKTLWTVEVESFGHRLGEHFGKPVHFSDECLTSYQVDRDLADGGQGPGRGQWMAHRRSGKDDSRAAALLLQDFFNEQNPSPLSQ